MVALFLPLDAVASIMDGSLMAAKQTDYLSYIQIAGAGVQVSDNRQQIKCCIGWEWMMPLMCEYPYGFGVDVYLQLLKMLQNSFPLAVLCSCLSGESQSRKRAVDLVLP